MNIVFIKVRLCLLDDLKGFFEKLKRYVGDFRIERQTELDALDGIMTISFYTDKIKIKDSESRQVELFARRDLNGWDFTRIELFKPTI